MGSYSSEYVRTTKAELHDELSLSEGMVSSKDISSSNSKEAEANQETPEELSRFLQSQSTEGDLEFPGSTREQGLINTSDSMEYLKGHVLGAKATQESPNLTWTIPLPHCTHPPPPPTHMHSISLIEETVTPLDRDDITLSLL